MAILPALESIVKKGFEGTIIFALNPKGAWDVIPLDVTTRRHHSESGNVAAFPVENGIDGVDNMHRNPPELVVEGIFTDTPISYLAVASQIIPGRRSIELYRKLCELRDREEPVFVYTDIRQYASMVIETISVDEDAETGDCIPVTIAFKHAPILFTAFVPSQFDVIAKIAGAGGTVDMGTQSAISPRDYVGPTAVPGG